MERRFYTYFVQKCSNNIQDIRRSGRELAEDPGLLYDIFSGFLRGRGGLSSLLEVFSVVCGRFQNGLAKIFQNRALEGCWKLQNAPKIDLDGCFAALGGRVQIIRKS